MKQKTTKAMQQAKLLLHLQQLITETGAEELQQSIEAVHDTALYSMPPELFSTETQGHLYNVNKLAKTLRQHL